MTGDAGFLSIFLLTAVAVASSLPPKELNEESEFLLLAPRFNNWCTSVEKKHDSLALKCPGYEQIQICPPGVFQKHSFLTRITVSHCSLYVDII